MQLKKKLVQKIKNKGRLLGFGRPVDEVAAPAYIYSLLMISINAAEHNQALLKYYKNRARQQGADLFQIEMAIYRGEQLAEIDQLEDDWLDSGSY